MCGGEREERARKDEVGGADKVTACGGRVRGGEGCVFSRRLGRTGLFCFVPIIFEGGGNVVLLFGKL